MSEQVLSAWSRVVAALGDHGKTLALRPGREDVGEVESALGVTLPEEYRAWLALHDGEDDVAGRVDFLPAAETRLLPLDETLARWKDTQEWFSSDEDLEAAGLQDEDRIRNVVLHARRVIIASNAYGDGDNLYLDLCPGPAGKVGQVIVAVTECDFEVVGDGFCDFLARLATALEDGLLEVLERPSGAQVVRKGTSYGRWESVLRSVVPR